jgi:malate dehydrogenase (oxaloacetate-decarboxylating)(NADP+)
LQRKGFDQQDIHRLAARDRHVFAALMLAHGHGDALVTGATRKSAHVLELINHVFDARPEGRRGRRHGPAAQGRIVLIADTLVHEWPDERTWPTSPTRPPPSPASGAGAARGLPVSFSTFGYPVSRNARPRCTRRPRFWTPRRRFRIRGRDDGGRGAEPGGAWRIIPFSRLTGPANVLVVPARHSASISVKLMQEMAGATVIGPILTGVDKPIQICPPSRR